MSFFISSLTSEMLFFISSLISEMSFFISDFISSNVVCTARGIAEDEDPVMSLTGDLGGVVSTTAALHLSEAGSITSCSV
jgi:hypothetical protein